MKSMRSETRECTRDSRIRRSITSVVAAHASPAPANNGAPAISQRIFRRFGARFIATTNLITVRAVEPGSPADKAGFKKGDVVLRVDNKPAKNIMTVNRELISAGPKREVSFVLERGAATHNTTVKLIPETTFFNSSLVQAKLGCSVQDMTPEIATRLGRNSMDGVVITAVDRNSPAEAAGLKRGYVIEAINDTTLPDVTVAAHILHGIEKGGRANLTVYIPRPPRRGVVQVRVR